MKIKNILLKSFFVAVIALGFCLVGCNDGPTSSTKDPVVGTFTGLEVLATANGECGEYYEFEKPEVLYDSKPTTLAIEVKMGERIIPHDNVKVYLDSVGTYTVTYTASCDGQKTSKTTELVCSDTTAPTAFSDLDFLFYNQPIVLTDYIEVRDLSEITESKIMVTKQDGSPLPDGVFDQETNTFLLEDETIKKVKIKVNAKDEYDNVLEKTYDYLITPIPYYGSFDFSPFDTNETKIGGLKVATNGNASGLVVEDNGEKYYSVTVETTTINQVVLVNFDEILIGDFSKFDYIDVEMRLDYTLNGGNGGLNGAEFGGAPVNVVQNLFQAHKGEWFTYRYTGSAVKKSITNNEGLCLLFKPWGEQTVTIQIKSIIGAYELAAEKEYDLTEQLGLSANEITDVKFNGSDVADVTAFYATTNGTLTFTAKKDGYYKATDMSVNVKALPTYDPLFDFDNPDGTKLSASKGSVVTVGEDEDGSYVELRGTDTNQHLHINSLAGIEGLRQYDWYKITYKAYYEDAEGNAVTSKNFCLRPGNKWIKDAFAANGVKTTYEVNRNNQSNFEDTIASTAHPNVSYVCQSYDTSNTLVVRFYDIEFGFNDTAVEKGTIIDLTSKFSLQEDEFTATFIPTGGTESEITDKAEWIPTESGVLTVVVKKDGYKERTFTINVKVVSISVEDGGSSDQDENWDWGN